VTLPRAFYRRQVPIVARDLLGCIVVSRRGRIMTAGRIVETEAYLGPEDGASHAAFRPGAHPLLYGDGGFAYVFPAYGLHVCLNAVARERGKPGCVLLRALEPVGGPASPAVLAT
jgi:DNA-3-methyladenine glycosylase